MPLSKIYTIYITLPFFLKNQDLESPEFKTYEKIYKAFSEITEHTFNIIPDKDNYITLYFKRGEDGWIASNACGLGLSDILVIMTFTLDFDYNFILIEEPESHVHPDMQRKLLHFLHRNIDKQFFLSTHSNIYLDSAIVDKVFFSSFNTSVEISDATSKSSILFDLGYSVTDNLVSDIVILVEGPKDIPIIDEFLIKMDLHESFDIKIWPLGGDIMDQLDLSVFAQNYTILALVDQDPNSDHVREKFLANCTKYSIPVTRLKRYAIENYFSVSALKEVFGAQFPKSITEIKHNIKLKDQIKIDVKRNNKKIAQAMTINDIKDTDLHKFFKKVQKTLQDANKA
ncbi:MAG: ATP-dependent nuclease [Candidatus Anammoxibacter sp.]